MFSLVLWLHNSPTMSPQPQPLSTWPTQIKDVTTWQGWVNQHANALFGDMTTWGPNGCVNTLFGDAMRHPPPPPPPPLLTWRDSNLVLMCHTIGPKQWFDIIWAPGKCFCVHLLCLLIKYFYYYNLNNIAVVLCQLRTSRWMRCHAIGPKQWVQHYLGPR